MRSGQFDRQIVLQSRSSGTDSDGFPVDSFATLATVWARKRFLRGDERYLGDRQQQTAEVEVEYRIRYRDDVDPTVRVKDSGELWDVEAVLEADGSDIGPRRRALDLICTRFDPDDEE